MMSANARRRRAKPQILSQQCTIIGQTTERLEACRAPFSHPRHTPVEQTRAMHAPVLSARRPHGFLRPVRVDICADRSLETRSRHPRPHALRELARLTSRVGNAPGKKLETLRG